MMRFVLCVLPFVALNYVSASSSSRVSATSLSHATTEPQTSPPPTLAYTITPVPPLCEPTDTPDVCLMKKTQCSFITKALTPPGGYIKTFLKCAKEAGIVLGNFFFTSIGEAFKSGAPETISDLTSPDLNVVIGIRRCAMNATGLVFPDMSLDRMAIANALVVASNGSPLGYAVAAASASCSQPRSYRMADYLSCLKQICVKRVVLPTEPSPSPSDFSSQFPGSSP
ncbi:uncharacterized protein LOC125039605 [Penaeus chinensis]|uniref:uncharacterized protein LOC125039605 n=1 Tax=Penaeus chinensis TaxID=139456 RepID=UPI001FB6EFC5|nr:uncharacterized protein LOC125039605 [Penaeus chinensis]